MSALLTSWLFLVLVCVTIKVIEERIRYLRKYEIHMREFYKAAAMLLSYEHIPNPVLDMISFLQTKTHDRLAAAGFLMHLVKRDRVEIAGAPESASLKAINQFVDERPEQGTLFEQVCILGVLAMSYRAYILGGSLRAFVFFDAEQHPARTRDVVVGFYNVEAKTERS